jgi:hypothetical protein
MTINATPAHQQVDWATKSGRTTDATVVITCPVCAFARRTRAASVAMLIRRGRFTGRCMAHRDLIGPRRNAGYRPRPGACAEYQSARGVDYASTQLRPSRGGRQLMIHVKCVCLRCGAERWRPPSTIQAQLRKGTYTGLCRRCSASATIEKTTDGRHINSSGYVVVTKRGLPQELHGAFDLVAAQSQRRVGPYVMEHTVIMVAKLGRALRPDETVHHINGKRSDNREANLRLYKRGDHHPGYGDFYQEWQEALSENARLKDSVTAHAHLLDT